MHPLLADYFPVRACFTKKLNQIHLNLSSFEPKNSGNKAGIYVSIIFGNDQFFFGLVTQPGMTHLLLYYAVL